MVCKIPELIFADMRIIKPALAFLNTTKTFRDLRIASTNRFHLGALQHNARLKTVTHKIIVVGLAVADFLKTVLR